MDGCVYQRILFFVSRPFFVVVCLFYLAVPYLERMSNPTIR